jgi:transketolase
MLSRIYLANALRVLSMDAVQKANSGHPGMPMGMADVAEVLWNDFLNHNPQNPQWINRDRFILSNGHGCMLQYALLHLSGYDLSIEDLKQFRQLHSKTPGHPEYGLTPGVETTTGPLGQGLGNAVGMALAEAVLAANFNQGTHQIINHFTYCFIGDGCLMEGISHEVASLAGTLGLGKLIVFWDDNGISIDGEVAGWFLDNTPERFKAYGWHVVSSVDGHDPEAIKKAITEARSNLDKPSLICCKTIIGYGSPNLSGTEKTHGAALGVEEVAATREKLGWSHAPFELPTNIKDAWNAKKKGQQAEALWQQQWTQYEAEYPALAAELKRRLSGQLPPKWQHTMGNFILETARKAEIIATRKASQNTLTAMLDILPELLGGSADLSESNLTHCKQSKALKPHHFSGNYVYYGVREFGMSAIMNGISLSGGFIPYGGTFLTFLDYARNAVRLCALMKQRVIFVYTHDSIGLGEDGPTHQPIEHLGMLRTTPNISLWRPCDATETAVAWQQAIERTEGPTALALSRQAVKPQMRTPTQVDFIKKGGYVLLESQDMPELIMISTGSEVALTMEAALELQTQGLQVRVVSMPSMDVFLKQEAAYKESVIPNRVRARIAVEAAATNDWYQWVGLDGRVVGIDRFGESAPAKDVYQALGITVEAIVQAAKSVIKNLEKREYHHVN